MRPFTLRFGLKPVFTHDHQYLRPYAAHGQLTLAAAPTYTIITRSYISDAELYALRNINSDSKKKTT